MQRIGLRRPLIAKALRLRGARLTTWPKMYIPEAAPREVIALAEHLVPQMLVGDHPALVALRVQYDRGQVATVELTGAGFFVNYQVPGDTPHAKPSDFQGGDVRIEAAGVTHGAGCILFVRGGRLAFLECYTHGGEWPEDVAVLSVGNVQPLDPPSGQVA
jgi:hypothetical protein